ncbi:multidrug effflux MFS transporter [Microbacterium sp.]|uniref:multidrug effflux MFS transporter n=1 Tax=Microbacterium sp. TaxID=51671 RepID=UPI0039C9CB3D
MFDTASVPVVAPAGDPAVEPQPAGESLYTGSIPVTTGSVRVAAPTRYPGDALPNARRALYVVLLGALTALGPFTIDLYLPAFPVVQHDFHTSAAMVQLTLTGTMIGFGLGQLIVGPLSDRVGRRVPLLVVTALHVLASVVASLAPSLLLLGGARVVMGIGAAAGGVVAMAMVRDLFGGRRLVVMLSRLSLVSGVAPVAAPLVGSALLLVMPWRGIFLVLAAYGVVMLVCSLFVLPETLPRGSRGAADHTLWQRYGSVFRDRVFVGVLIIGAMAFSGLFSYLSSSSFLFQDGYGFTPQQFGMLFAANSVGVVGGVQVASRLARHFGPQWVLAWSTAALVLASVAIIVTDQLHLGMWGTIVPLFFFMTACGFTFPCGQVLALDRHGSAAGTAASLLGAANSVVAGLVSPIVGMIAAGSGITATTMAMVMIGCALVAVVSLWTLVRPRTVPMLAD